MLVKTNTTIPLELRVTDLFGQAKTDITSVTFRIYHRVAGSIVQDIVQTAMSGSGSLWYYSVASGLANAGEYVIEYTITDTSNEVYLQTEQLEVGYLESDIATIKLDVNFIKQIESGRWKIENNQMKFYDTYDNVILTFNLFDENNKPTNDSAMERVPA